jgi:hypothetical protein
VLGQSIGNTRLLGRLGVLQCETRGRRLWFRASAVQALVRAREADRREWVTIPQAMQMVGCNEGAIHRAIARGEVEQRTMPKRYPSLRRSSVAQFAESYQRGHAAQQKQLLAEQTARDERARLQEPPASPNGEVWLDRNTAALVLGMSSSGLSSLAARDRVPATQVGKRLWFERGNIERLRAARAFTESTRRQQ